jgi:hypothetical protein
MPKSDSSLKIRPAQLEDQECVSSLLSGFKLPLDGLEITKMWILQDANGNIVGTAGLEQPICDYNLEVPMKETGIDMSANKHKLLLRNGKPSSPNFYHVLWRL